VDFGLYRLAWLSTRSPGEIARFRINQGSMYPAISMTQKGETPRLSSRAQRNDCDKIAPQGLSRNRNGEKGGSRSRRNAIVLALAMVAGCDATTNQRPVGPRILTGFEMDQVTAGSAVAADNAAAHGRGFAPQTEVVGIASAYSGISPIAAAPILDYANAQATASASGSNCAQTSLSSQLSVDAGNGGASVDAKAAATGSSQAQVTAQLYGIGTNRSDLVFGSVAASACCGSDAAAQIDIDSTAGGPYSRELRSAPASAMPGQVQNRVDIATVSSALPLVDPAQILVAGAPARTSPKY
jgi:hypothetical protein